MVSVDFLFTRFDLAIKRQFRTYCRTEIMTGMIATTNFALKLKASKVQSCGPRGLRTFLRHSEFPARLNSKLTKKQDFTDW